MTFLKTSLWAHFSRHRNNMKAKKKTTPHSVYIHHLYYEKFNRELKTFSEVCGFSSEDAEPVIRDEATERTRKSFSRPSEANNYSEYSSPFSEEISAVPENSSISTETDTDAGTENVTDSSGLSGFDRFYSQQQNKHRKFYFALGLSVFLLILLGIVSGVYLVITKIKAPF